MDKLWTVTLLSAALLFGGCKKKTDSTNKAPPQTDPAEKADPGMKTPRARPMRADPAPGPAPAAKTGPRLVQLWSTGGLKVPESVLHDAARQVIYVSCIGGKPTEKNGRGFIAKLSLDGKIQTLEWAKGMNAPKGMGLKGDTLWVTDIDRLHAIDVKTGRITRTIDVPEAKFLNDIAIGPKGRVFVSDMVTRRVLVLKDEKLVPFADLTALKGANGMLVHEGQLLVGTATGIARVDLATGKSTLLVPVKGYGMIDGLRTYASDAWITSNWKGRTQVVRKDGQVKVLKDTTAAKIQSADLEYIAATRTLLIPTFFHNHVVAYRIEP